MPKFKVGDKEFALSAVEVPAQLPAINPDNPQKGVTENIERLRYFAEEQARNGALTGEAVEKIALDLKRVDDQQQELADLKVQLKRTEEIAKAAEDASKGRIDNADKIVHALRQIPQRYEMDEETKAELSRPMSDTHYNLIASTREEIADAIGGSEAESFLRKFSYLNNALVLTDAVMMADMNPQRRQRYIESGGIKSLKLYPKYAEAAKLVSLALDTSTAGGSSEWVPTMWSSTLFSDVQHRTGVLALFPATPMPNNPWGFPFLINGGEDVELTAESTADPSAFSDGITASDVPASSSFYLKAGGFKRLTYWSREVDQDSIVAVLPTWSTHDEYKHRLAKSAAIINAQPASSNLGTYDTGRSITAKNVRLAFSGCSVASYGLRRSAGAVGGVDFAGALTAENGAAVIGKLGAYADPALCSWVAGYSIAARLLVAKDSSSGGYLYLTQDKAGAAATAFTGQMGLFMGYPFVADGMYPEDLNASGIYDGSGVNNKTSIVLCRRDMFVAGQRQGRQVEVSDHAAFKQDLRVVKSTERFAFSPTVTPSSTYKVAAFGYNIPSYS